MIKKNLLLIIVTSLITLLPALLMKSFMPLILLLVHLVCIFATSKDKGNQEQSEKVFRMVFWMCPIIALYTSGINYLVMEGKYSGIEEISISLFGLLFIIIGNYLPKCKMNATIGIKIPWTYSSEENWRRTHRFGGKVWVVCGLLIMGTMFVPANAGGTMMIALFIAMVIVPMIYSYLFYKKEVKEGKADLSVMHDKAMYNKKAGKASTLFLLIILALVAVMMFVGNIDYVFEEDALLIEADFWGDMRIEYDEIEAMEYLENDVRGSRTNGYGSARLLMGTFRNEEYEYYTRYSYTKCETGIMLDLGNSIVVISDMDEVSTQILYEEIVSMLE